MINFKDIIGKKILIIDGAMGTLLMEAGIRPEEGFDLQNIKHPDVIRSIHKKYIDAGADIIETNTFGANRIKLKDYGMENEVARINSLGVEIALQAANGKAYVCGSIGPLGKLIEPLGKVSFDEAADVFAEQAVAMEKAGAHCVSIETISDLQEMRAAVIGIKAKASIPIIASLSYDDNGLTVFGTSPEAAVITLEALGIDIISANCSTGPEAMLKIAKRLLAVASVPVMVMPNAGMPVIENDKAIYKMTPVKFASYAKKFAQMGVAIIGGCCGTKPEHIREVKIQVTRYKKQTKLKSQTTKTKFASRSKVVEVKDGKLLVIGERINPTGKKLLREDIKSKNFIILNEEAKIQKQADLLDVNVSVADANDAENIKSAIHIIEKTSGKPLSIDSPSPSVLEAGLKTFCGRALLNSVNGKKESLEKVLPLAKKYGAAIIGLTLDGNGIPKTVKEKLAIAEKIITEALKVGIKREDIFIDNLVMTAAMGIDEPFATLEAVKLVKKKFGVKTSLGVSNISHGFPNRSKLNALYLELAICYGLDAAIIDITNPQIKKVLSKPKSKNPKLAIKTLKAKMIVEIEKAKKGTNKPKKEIKLKEIKFKSLADIKNAVIDSNIYKTTTLVNLALTSGINPQKIIDEGLVPGMEVIGARFSKKKIFLPQVLSSAEAMSAGFEICKARIPKDEIKNVGTVLIATVHGDIHDIGKNIVKMMLENHGFQVIDLGKDVPPDKIIEAAKQYKPNAIALSALLTTTMLEMGIVKEKLKAAGLNIPIIVGGAVVTPDYAEKIGASYGQDAAQSVKLAKEIIKRSSS